MPKIILMNAGTEQMLGGEFTPAQRMLAAKAGWRQMWFAEHGDVIVTPSSLHADWMQYIGTINGFDVASVSIIALDETGDVHEILSDRMLSSSALVERVRAHLGEAEEWTIMAAYYSAGVVEFAARLGLSAPPGSALAGQRGTDLFNRKSHFRQLAAGIRLPVPEGAVAFDAATLEQALRRYVRPTGTAIVKQDDNVLGLGNVGVTTKALREPLAGVVDVLEVGNNWSDVAESLWTSMSGRSNHNVVVETYHQASHHMYAEYWIESDGVPRLLNMGTLRMAASTDAKARGLVWQGLEIPARLPPFAAATMASESCRLATLAASMGFRGLVNIDAMLTEGGDVLFNEINGRWGGNSILHTLATHLLGDGYADRACVSSRRNIEAAPLDQVLEALRRSGLALEPGETEGVLVLAIDLTFSSSMECLIVGATWDRVHELEARLLTEMANLGEAT